MTNTPTLTVHDTDTKHTYIRNRQMLFGARLLWVLCFALNITLSITHTPFLFVGIRDTTVSLPQRLLMDVDTHSELWDEGLRQLNIPPELPATLLVIAFRVSEIVAFSVSLMIFVYRSDNWMALWLSFAVSLVGVGSAAYLTLHVLPAGNWLFGIYSFMLILTAVLILFLLPDGRLYPKNIRWVIAPYVLWEIFRHYQQAIQSELFVTTPFIFWYVPLLVLFFVGVVAQFNRYRHASPIGKHQIKWLIFGVAVYFVSYLLFFTRLLLSNLVAATGTGAEFIIYQVVMASINPIGTMILSISVGFAVTRYRLYDVNFVINRSLVYGVVTATLALVFVGGGFFLQSILGSEQTGIAFVVSILAAGLLFNPVRQRAQRFIDRRFYGFRFDLYQVKRAQKLPEIKNPGALTGTKLGKYQVLGLIGRGGMGEVYQGWYDGRAVALKILLNPSVKKDDHLKRFEREAQTLAELNHPNIIKLYEAGENDGVYYLAMELVEGRELSDIIKEDGALPFDDVCAFVEDFAATLDYAHQKGLIHRDIKPSNIMMRTKDGEELGEAVLMDFGVAKILDAAPTITGTGAIGTIGYMAPEQIIEAKAVDHRVDIYALGVLVYEMLTGERPFKGAVGQVLFAHLQQPPPDPRDFNKTIPAHAAHAVLKALEKAPEDRFQTAGELAAALVAVPVM